MSGPAMTGIGSVEKNESSKAGNVSREGTAKVEDIMSVLILKTCAIFKEGCSCQFGRVKRRSRRIAQTEIQESPRAAVRLHFYLSYLI